MVVETEDSPAHDWALRVCRVAGFEPRIRYRSDDVLLHVRLVEAGRAAALLPSSSAAAGSRPSGSTAAGVPQARRIFTVVRAEAAAIRRSAGAQRIARRGDARPERPAPARDRAVDADGTAVHS